MLVSPFSALDDPFAMLVLGCGASGLGWAVFSLAVRELGCELGTLISPFSALVLPFSVSGFGWVDFSLVVKALGCE